MKPPFERVENHQLVPEDVIHLAEHLDVCRRRSWLIVGLAVTVSALVAIWCFFQNPIYQATAGLVIEPHDPQVLQRGDENMWRPSQYALQVETHLNLMTTYPVLEETARRVNLSEQPEYQPRSSPMKDMLMGLKPAWFKDVRGWLLGIKKRMKAVLGGPAMDIVGQADNKMADELPPQAERARIKAFAKHVTIDYVEGSKLVQITVESEDPVFAARAANTLIAVYIDKTLELKARTTGSAAKWFAAHLDDLRRRVEESEHALYAYRSANNLVNVSDQQSMAAHKLAKQNLELVEAERRRTEARTRYQQIQAIQAKVNSGSKREGTGLSDLDSLTEVLNSPVIRDLRIRETALSVETAKLSKKYGRLHPKMIQAQTELKEQSARIRQEVDRIYRAAKNEHQLALAREAAVREKVAKQKPEKMLVDKRVAQYNILEREAYSHRQLYDQFLKQMRETNLSTESEASNLYMAEPAMPNSVPVRPRTFLFILLGLVAGLAAGIGLAFSLEYWDRTLKGPLDVERYLAGQLLLGWVPMLPGTRRENHARLVEREPLSAAADSYRHIRTSVRLSTPDQEPFALVITSPGEQEGKTTLAVNLATTVSHVEGSRVVLLDADLRRPRVGKIFGIKEGTDKGKGLVQYLVGDAEVGEILHQTKMPNLLVIPAGDIPPNPTELLQTKRMAVLFQWFNKNGVNLVVDSPPVLPVTDATVIASMLSGTVLVVSAGETNREAARAAIEHLTRSGAQILGVVMQKVSLRRTPHYYWGYASQSRRISTVS